METKEQPQETPITILVERARALLTVLNQIYETQTAEQELIELHQIAREKLEALKTTIREYGELEYIPRDWVVDFATTAKELLDEKEQIEQALIRNWSDGKGETEQEIIQRRTPPAVLKKIEHLKKIIQFNS